MARFTIDMDEQFERILKKLSDKKGATKAEIIRRALATYSYFQDNIDEEAGQKASITDSEDDVVKDVIVP